MLDCPATFVFNNHNLDGEGKVWHACPPPLNLHECLNVCANICNAMRACTSFEYNSKTFDCGTYTGGGNNIVGAWSINPPDWLSCFKQYNPPSPPPSPSPPPLPPLPPPPPCPSPAPPHSSGALPHHEHDTRRAGSLIDAQAVTNPRAAGIGYAWPRCVDGWGGSDG